jgi:hypothetical protein
MDSRPGNQLDGPLHCYATGCPRSGARCGYTDGAGHHCLSAWCAEHQTLIGDTVYCRRHAGVMAALNQPSAEGVLPDLDNRALSLVNWVARDLDEPVSTLLEALAADPAIEHVTSTLATSSVRRDGVRIWRRGWSLDAAGGNSIVNVILEVAEDDDAKIVLRANRRLVTVALPPWVERRLAANWVPPDVDAEERRRFYADIRRRLLAALS